MIGGCIENVKEWFPKCPVASTTTAASAVNCGDGCSNIHLSLLLLCVCVCVIHLCYPSKWSPPLLPLHNETELWSEQEMCGEKRQCWTNSQSKGKTEQQCDLIVHPLNPHSSWQVLKCKARLEGVCWLAIRSVVYFSPAEWENTLLLICLWCMNVDVRQEKKQIEWRMGLDSYNETMQVLLLLFPLCMQRPLKRWTYSR